MRQNKKTRARVTGKDSFFENLENRTLLSGVVTVAVASNAMTITGDSSDNSIVIQDTGVGTFNITGTNGTSISYSSTTTLPDIPVSITGATKDLTINMSTGGIDTVDAANALQLTDGSGNRYSLTYTGGTGDNSLFKSVAASGMIGFLDAPNAIQEVQDVALDNTSTGGTFKITIGSSTTPSLVFDTTRPDIGSALDTLLSITPTAEVQTLTLDALATGGHFHVQVGSGTSAAINWNATTTQIGTAMDTLLGITTVGEDQTITMNAATASGGTYTLTVAGQTTAPLSYSDNAAAIQAALESALSLGGGSVTVTGQADTGSINIVYPSSLGDIAMTTIDGTSLTGPDSPYTGTGVTNVDGIVGTVVSAAPDASRTITFTIPSQADNLPLMSLDISALTSVSTANFAPVTDGVAGTVVSRTIASGGTPRITFPSSVGNLPLMSMNTALLTGNTVVATPAGVTDGNAVGTKASGQIVISDAPGTASRGSISFISQAVAGDRVTINDGAGNVRTYQAVASGAVAGQFNIGADMYATATNLANAINATNPVLSVTAVGSPVGTKEQQTLTPTGSASTGTFTITYGSSTTGAINYNATAATVQTALRSLPGLSTATVTGGRFDQGSAFTVTFPVAQGDAALLTLNTTGLTGGTPVVAAQSVQGVLPGTPEVQRVTPGGLATAGTFTLSYGGNTTTALAFGASTATVQTALRLLPGLSGITVTGSALSAGAMNFTFLATMGDVSMITMNATSLTPATGYTWTEQTRGIAPASVKLTNDVLGAAGNQSITVSTFSRPRMSAIGMTAGGITNAVAGDYVTISDGVHAPKTFTFGTDVAVGATAAASADNLIAAINAVGGSSLLITASTITFDGTINLVQNAAGSAGNTTILKSGAQIAKTDFSGGTTGTNIQDGETITIDDGMNPTITFTAKRANPDASLNQFQIGGDAIASMANFVTLAQSTPLLNVSIVDNYDGSCTITNNVAGTFGNGDQLGSLTASGTGVAASDFSGGAGYAIDCLNFTATMGAGSNTIGIGGGGGGQSYIYGNLALTGGAKNDAMSLMGVFVGGTMTVNLGAADTTGGDSFSMSDEGTVPSFVAGDTNITQGAGMATVTLQNSPLLSSKLELNKLTIDLGPSATGTSVTTINNTVVDGVFTYGGATDTDADTLNLTGSVDLGDAATINLGAGANQFNTTGAAEVQTLTPDASASAGTYTFTYNGRTTSTINYDASLAQIQTALRTLPGCESVTVSGDALVGKADVQTLTSATRPTGGTYKLTFGGITTSALNFNATTATVQTALRKITALQNVVVSGSAMSAGDMIFTLPLMGNAAMITIDTSSLTGGAVYSLAKTTTGGVLGKMVFTWPSSAGHASMLSPDFSGITGTSSSSTLIETTAGSDFYFGSLAGGAFTYTGGAGTDGVSLGGRVSFGGTATFTLGTANNGDATNTMTVTNALFDGALSITGGTGADNISLGTSNLINRGSITITPLAGINTFAMDNADINGFTYTGVAGDDALTIGATRFSNSGNFSATTGDGTNSLTMDNATITGTVTYTGGLGADTVTIGTKSFEAKNTVTLNMGAAGIDGTNTNNATVNGRSKGLTYTGGAGTDNLMLGTIAGRGYVMDGQLSVTGGAGANELDYDGSLRGLGYTGGANADVVKLGAGVVGKFAATAAVTIAGGDGANTTTIKNATIRGADTSGNGLTYTGGINVDTVNIGQGGAVGVTVLKGTSISLGTGDDILTIDNSNFSATSGAFSVNSGLGDDHIYFDVNVNSRTIFNRATTIDNATSAGGNDLFTDRAVVGSAGTKYLGVLTATKLVFKGFLAPALGRINGSVGGTINGSANLTPTVSAT